MKNIIISIIVLVFAPSLSSSCFAQYRAVDHRKVCSDEVAVKTAGSFARAGTTYVLANDITSPTSTVFLGKDVTLDLNGYTLRYADGGYEHIPNSGFEEGLKGWDITKAPGAEVKKTADVHVFMGDKLMSLKAGDEITSSYIHLPVADRSYFAMCGITGHYYHDMEKYPRDEMRISVYVEDENGHEVKCAIQYGDTIKQGCPVEQKRPRLGGGFVYAHLANLPAGKYRVRVKADTDCLIDEVDIRPAMDVGVSIIEKTVPLAHYDHVIMESRPPTIPSFYDYTEDMAIGKPFSSLPIVTGTGTITIKNGTIESGTTGIQSWGVQSSANDVKVILENVNIKTSGISSGAADIPYAHINNCTFDVDMPFLIQRHVGLCAVIIRGDNAAEISNSVFNGGQGCLSVKGKRSLVHGNLFINDQKVTNHYSIMGTGDSSKIYNNRFEPKQGSGIYVSRHTEVFDNTFKIETSPPTCEYGREEYSTAAIRLGDYGAKPGSPRASVGNRIHHNKIHVTAREHPAPDDYLPMAWGIFYSACGGENYVYNNEITVHKTDLSSKTKTAAFYICGGAQYFGGQFYENHITTNVPAAWIATMYGGASNSKLYNNTIVATDTTDFKTFKIGSYDNDANVAKNIEFRSNKVERADFEIEATDQDHCYSVYWTLNIDVANSNGQAAKNICISIRDKNNKVVLRTKANVNGKLTTELPEYVVAGNIKQSLSPYTIIVGKEKQKVELRKNTDISFVTFQ